MQNILQYKSIRVLLIIIIFLSLKLYSQDSVAVTFYYKTSSSVSIVYLPGSFNNWGDNNSGLITNPKFAMNYDGTKWYKTLKLPAGTFYYKFNENGSTWVTDPINKRVSATDNNSTIIVTDPMVFYLQDKTISDTISNKISCYLYSSENNPINPDSIFVQIENDIRKDTKKYYDPAKKLLEYPVSLSKGTYKIKIFVKNMNGQIGVDSSTISVSFDPVYPTPYEFIFDPKSSYNVNKNITSAYLRGVFNNWGDADPMVYDNNDELWKATKELLPNDYEYKFYLNRSTWIEDPDNPRNRGSNNNSLVTVKNLSDQGPSFKEFSFENGKIFADSIQEFQLTTKIYPGSSKSPVDQNTISVTVDGKSISYSFDQSTNILSLNITKDLFTSNDIHKILLQCKDKEGKSGKYSYSFAKYASTDGYFKLDESDDESLLYPEYVSKGSADLEMFNVSANKTLDSLIFRIKVQNISDYTRVGFQMFNTILGSFSSEIPNINLQTTDWSDQGFFIRLMNPASPLCDTINYNIIYTSKSPIKKSNKIILDRNGLAKNEFKFSISLSDISDMMGKYSDKKYFSVYSYLSGKDGSDIPSDLALYPQNQPMVYDILFAKKIKQDLLLSNFSASRTARLDAETRGIISILPEMINPDLKSGAPNIKFLTRSNPEVHTSSKIIEGEVDDPSVSAMDIYKNNVKFNTYNVTNGKFSAYVPLSEGDNLFKAVGMNSKGIIGSSSSIKLTYIKDHFPKPVANISNNANIMIFNATSSTDPDNDISQYLWQSDDVANPVKLNITSTGSVFQIIKPTVPGEYFFNLTVTDKLGNQSKVRNYFTLNSDGTVTIPDANSNVQWVKDAIVYEIFIKSMSQNGNGTFNDVINKIQYIKDLGVNTLWLMPIMHNANPVTEMSGGYSIDDFYNTAPQFGTLDDYKRLVDSAHANGIKIILDITPNHVSDRHPWVNDIRSFGKYSNYYDYIERNKLGDDRGMGQTLHENIYVGYSNWTLANLNLSTDDCKNYMINMFKWWLLDKNTDGFRYDVYWGPNNRYGKEVFWRPVREELKKVKPEIFLLGETDGTGTGSEYNYADKGGACDAAYDWTFYTSAKGVFSIGANSIHDKVTNYNYSPGTNAYFFRFLENHDEDRIATVISNNDQRKFQYALLMSVPGIPMIYMGQEIGWTGRRTPVNFEGASKDILLPFYKRLTLARKKFAAFRTKDLTRINANDDQIYSFIRPYKDENAIAIFNIASTEKNISLNINESSLTLSNPLAIDKDYYLNDFSNDTYYKIKKSDLANLQFKLNPYESRVMILSEKILRIQTSVQKNTGMNIPEKTFLKQNYPNPFNPTTNIEYSVSEAGYVKIAIYDMLGREIKILTNEFKQPGEYTISFDAKSTGGGLSNGIYFYKLLNKNSIETKKMIVIK